MRLWVIDAPKHTGTYEMITPPNSVQARSGSGVGVDRHLTDRASVAVKNLQGQFLQNVAIAVGDIAATMAAAQHVDGSENDRAADIYRQADDLRMQAAAFDYPLLSDICASLCSYIEILSSPARLSGDVVGAHTDALQLVFDNGIQGDGGYEGLELIESLNKLVNRSRR